MCSDMMASGIWGGKCFNGSKYIGAVEGFFFKEDRGATIFWCRKDVHVQSYVHSLFVWISCETDPTSKMWSTRNDMWTRVDFLDSQHVQPQRNRVVACVEYIRDTFFLKKNYLQKLVR